MPKNLYNYQEFIRLSHEGKIAFEQIDVPKKRQPINRKKSI